MNTLVNGYCLSSWGHYQMSIAHFEHISIPYHIMGNFQRSFIFIFLKSITSTKIKLFEIKLRINSGCQQMKCTKTDLRNLIYHGFYETFCFENNPLYNIIRHVGEDYPPNLPDNFLLTPMTRNLSHQWIYHIWT